LRQVRSVDLGVHAEGHAGVAVAQERLDLGRVPPVYDEQSGRCGATQVVGRDLEVEAFDNLHPDPAMGDSRSHITAHMGGHQGCRSEASDKACPDAHRPTGACNTRHIISPSRIWAG
jgi:hypothetical protein